MTIDAQRHSAEMAAQRAQELAGDEKHYKLRKACVARAVELYMALKYMLCLEGTENTCSFDRIEQLMKEIEHDAQ